MAQAQAETSKLAPDLGGDAGGVEALLDRMADRDGARLRGLAVQAVFGRDGDWAARLTLPGEGSRVVRKGDVLADRWRVESIEERAVVLVATHGDARQGVAPRRGRGTRHRLRRGRAAAAPGGETGCNSRRHGNRPGADRGLDAAFALSGNALGCGGAFIPCITRHYRVILGGQMRSLLSILALLLVAGCASSSSRAPDAPRASWLLVGVDGQRTTPSLTTYLDRVGQQYAQRNAERFAFAHGNQVESLLGTAPAETIALVRFPGARGARDWYKSDAYQQLIPLRANTGTYWLASFEGIAAKLPGPHPAFLLLRGELPAPDAAEADAIKHYGGVTVAQLGDGDIDVLEGTPPKGAWRVIAFPSRGALAALWLDPDFRAQRERWNVAGKTSATLIDAVK